MSTEPMNLLILMSDEHTRRMTGCYGHDIVQTPNLDALAARGVRFDRAYVNCPICVPSRANFMTGQYVHRSGHWDNAHAWKGEPEGWSHRLTNQGHVATTIGKLHFHDVSDPNGLTESRVAMNIFKGRGDYFSSMRWRRLKGKVSHSADSTMEAGPGESHYTRFDRAATAEACSWLANESQGHDKPWCLMVSLLCPHPPLIAPPEFYEMYPLDDVDMPIAWSPEQWPDHPYWNEARPWRLPFDGDEYYSEAQVRRAIAAYYGITTFMDYNFGLVLAALEESGQAENTRIVYTSDHGEMLGGFGLWGKMCMYEDSVGTPLIIAGPDIPRGKTQQTIVSWADVFPTVLEGVGASPQAEDDALPGESLWPLAKGATDLERVAFSEYHAARSQTGNFMICDQRYKYVYYADGYPPQLFDLQEDPQELSDLHASPAHAAIRERLHAQLLEVCDPEAVNDRAFADQRVLIEGYGGEDHVAAEGPLIGATPTPVEFYEDGVQR